MGEYRPLFLGLAILLIFASGCVKQSSAGEENKQPAWVKDLIAREENGNVANPPAYLAACLYKSQTVYYLPPRCCDVSSILFDQNGGILCSPDGGFSGKGDGKCLDFFEERKNCEIIWKDKRPIQPL